MVPFLLGLFYEKVYFCAGGMAEWSNAAVLKTVDRLPAVRGFESLFLRKTRPEAHASEPLFFCTGPVERPALIRSRRK